MTNTFKSVFLVMLHVDIYTRCDIITGPTCFELLNLVNVQFIDMTISGTTAEEMLSLKI